MYQEVRYVSYSENVAFVLSRWCLSTWLFCPRKRLVKVLFEPLYNPSKNIMKSCQKVQQKYQNNSCYFILMFWLFTLRSRHKKCLLHSKEDLKVVSWSFLLLKHCKNIRVQPGEKQPTSELRITKFLFPYLSTFSPCSLKNLLLPECWQKKNVKFLIRDNKTGGYNSLGLLDSPNRNFNSKFIY